MNTFISSQSESSGPGGESFLKPQKAWVWRFSRNLHGVPGVVAADALKHWAVVVEYLDEDDKIDIREIYQAGQDKDGLVVASNAAFGKKYEKEWLASPGGEKEKLGERYVSQAAAVFFCKEVTNRRQTYYAFSQNCQQFVKEFTDGCVEGKRLTLPPTAEQCKAISSRISIASLAGIIPLLF